MLTHLEAKEMTTMRKKFVQTHELSCYVLMPLETLKIELKLIELQ